MRIRYLIPILLLAVAACAPAATPTDSHDAAAITVGDLQITDAWVRPATMMESSGTMATPESGGMAMEPGPVTSAAYLTIHNEGGEADKLLSASSDIAKAVELHNVKMENDVMSMFQVPFIDVPANEHATLKPGSFHIMFIGVNRELKVGDKVTLTLNFEKAGSVTLEADVRDMPK